QLIFVKDDPQTNEFWGPLGGYMEVTDEGLRDTVVEQNAWAATTVGSLTVDGSDQIQATPVEVDPSGLDRAILDSGAVLAIETPEQTFLWVGKAAPDGPRRHAMPWAQARLQELGRPASTLVTRLPQNSETAEFKALFAQWEAPVVFDFGNKPSTGVARVEEHDIDMEALHRRKQLDETPVDDGSGSQQVWIIQDHEKVEWPREKYGEFYSSDSFIVLYTYQQNGKDKYIIYFWLGRGSVQHEQGAAALLAVDLDQALGDAPVQCRVAEGHEPSHFKQLWHGNMVVHDGNWADRAAREGAAALYQVKGTTQTNAAAR
ncbi:unnamed protein product, partial [Heterosigma akashiwo]